VILQMETLGLGAIEEFPFLDPPDSRFVNDGYRLLRELGAVDEQRSVTRSGATWRDSRSIRASDACCSRPASSAACGSCS
jgi:HrpA-like RNA helicase